MKNMLIAISGAFILMILADNLIMYNLSSKIEESKFIPSITGNSKLEIKKTVNFDCDRITNGEFKFQDGLSLKSCENNVVVFKNGNSTTTLNGKTFSFPISLN